MPFDGSGNFSRAYSWQADRDNGIKILASRMDGEFDNFAAAMNVVFFRNGLVPMTGALNMGSNPLFGIAAGSAGALGVRFADDPNTGLFLAGVGRLALAAGGVSRVEANTAGATVNGLLTVTGSLNISGATTFNSTIFASGPDEQVRLTGTNPYLTGYSGAARSGFLQFTPGAVLLTSEQGSVELRHKGATKLQTQDYGVSVATLLANNVSIDSGAGPAYYSLNSGGKYQGYLGTNSSGGLYLNSNYGQIYFQMNGSTVARIDTAGYYNGPGVNASGNISTTQGISAVGGITGTGGVYVDIGLYMSRPNAQLADVSFNPGSVIRYDRNAAYYTFISEDTNVMTLGKSGVGVNGVLLNNGYQVWHTGNFSPAAYQPAGNYARLQQDAQFNDVIATRGGGQQGVYYFGTSGLNYINWQPNLLEIVMNGARVMRIDNNGNVRARGDVTANLGDNV